MDGLDELFISLYHFLIVIDTTLFNMNNKLDYIAIDFETANQYRNSACSVGLVRFIGCTTGSS